MNADVYEEGDFLTSTFGFALGSDLDRSKLLTELKVHTRARVRESLNMSRNNSHALSHNRKSRRTSKTK
jgi:hypothetical protein